VSEERINNMLFGNMLAKNHYTFACDGIKVQEKEFSSRQEANKYMYRVMAKYGLNLVEVYNDKHHKTYICNNNIKFFIQRAW
jgi:hypothetical protein